MEKEEFRLALKELAIEYGFSDASTVDPEELVYNEEFRQCCEDNVCGNYNANYSCPPYCGSVEEMRAKTLAYKNCLVLKTELEVDDAYDETITKPIKKDHSMRSKMLFKELRSRGMVEEGMAMLAGPCSLCDHCTMPEGLPCRFPLERTSCLSAYCLNVAEMAESAGITISWEGNQVSFFSLYFW